jgi:hypothetical protein
VVQFSIVFNPLAQAEAAVDELLRYDGPILSIMLRAKRDVIVASLHSHIVQNTSRVAPESFKKEVERRMEVTHNPPPQPAPVQEKLLVVKEDPPIRSGERFDFATQKWPPLV